jgi:hypothetical protein
MNSGHRKSLVLIITMLFSIPAISQSKDEKVNGPDCSGGWPTDMTFSHMKNAGLVNNPDIDFSNTKTTRLASQQIGKDLWHQVYRVTFTKPSGASIEAIAVHDASIEECSMSGVEVFVVSKRLVISGFSATN